MCHRGLFFARIVRHRALFFVRNVSKSLDGCCLRSSFVMTILLFYLIVIWWYGRERVDQVIDLDILLFKIHRVLLERDWRLNFLEP